MRYPVKTVAAILIVYLASTSYADPLNLSSDINLTLTQHSYSKNWKGAEIGSFSWNFISGTDFKLTLSERIESRNSAKLEYGMSASQNSENGDWSAPFKSSDRIDFESVFICATAGFVDPFASIRMESQFYDANMSDLSYFDPITLSESIGAVKIIVDNGVADLSARIGFGMRQYFDRNTLTDSISNRIENIYTRDGGIQFVNDLRIKLVQTGISIKSKLTLFQALYFSESDKLEGGGDWKNIDVDWENMIISNISKNFMVSLYLQLLYDKQISDVGMLKQTLALGITYVIL